MKPGVRVAPRSMRDTGYVVPAARRDCSSNVCGIPDDTGEVRQAAAPGPMQAAAQVMDTGD
ncbi:MAG: hypothetical protein JSV19_12705 [Phycisphaerales bacterium]|nr:MAG: hypothetical protein JSV19_12705 [Phycisphaerales bacterium]